MVIDMVHTNNPVRSPRGIVGTTSPVAPPAPPSRQWAVPMTAQHPRARRARLRACAHDITAAASCVQLYKTNHGIEIPIFSVQNF